MKKIFCAVAICMCVVLSFTSCSSSLLYSYLHMTESTETQTVSESEPYSESTPETSENELLLPPDREGEVSTPLFWRVSGNGYTGNFYLLGSIHVGDGDTNLYPREIYDGFNSCDFVAVESNIISLESNLKAQMEMLKLFVYKDMSSISAHIRPPVYIKARNILKSGGYYNNAMDYYTPIMWSMLIDQCLAEKTDFSYDFGVDRFFLENACGKEIIEVEDYLKTQGLLASLSEDAQEFVLEMSVDDEEVANYGESCAALYRAWKAGDRESLYGYLFPEYELTEREEELFSEYNSALMDVRNENMIRTADSLIKEGKNVFYIVGLAHMLGEDGIVEGLKSMGYSVDQVRYGG